MPAKATQASTPTETTANQAGLLTTQQRLGRRESRSQGTWALPQRRSKAHTPGRRKRGGTVSREELTRGGATRYGGPSPAGLSAEAGARARDTHGARPGGIRESLSPRAPLAQRQVNPGQEATRPSTLAAPGQLIVVRAMPSGSSDWTCGAQHPAEAGRQEPRGRRSERRDGYGASTAAPASQGRGQGDRSTLLRFKTVSSEGRKKRPAPAYLFQERRRDQASQTMGIQSWCKDRRPWHRHSKWPSIRGDPASRGPDSLEIYLGWDEKGHQTEPAQV